VIACLLMIVPGSAYGQVPPTMNYQGVLVDDTGTPAADGSYEMTFSIYDEPTGGTPLWQETQSAMVVAGVYNVVMGNVKPIQLTFDKTYFLGVAVDGDDEMVPRQPLTSVAYAFRAKTADTMPIGTVIDWWRPDDSWLLPEGFQICDGSTVNDPDSPLNGRTVPDLTNTFILGVSSPSQIGSRGGSESHDHAVDIDHDHASVNTTSSGYHRHTTDPPAMSTSASGSHTHSVDIPGYSATLSTQYAGSHNHKWAEFYRNPNDGVEQWITYTSSGASRLTTVWDNGIGNEGSGHYPLSEYYNNNFFTLSGGNHRHDYSLNHDHPMINSSSSGTHSHSVDFPTLYSSYTGTHTHIVDLPAYSQLKLTESVNHLPPYFGLLKIMRIK
jgi:hypothetical protein